MRFQVDLNVLKVSYLASDGREIETGLLLLAIIGNQLVTVKEAQRHFRMSPTLRIEELREVKCIGCHITHLKLALCPGFSMWDNMYPFKTNLS